MRACDGARDGCAARRREVAGRERPLARRIVRRSGVGLAGRVEREGRMSGIMRVCVLNCCM